MQRRLWNVNEFDKVNLPEILGKVDANTFSEFNGVRILDMPIYMPGQGWKIPDDVSQFLEPIAIAVESERRFGFEKDHFVYVTIDQKIVQEGKTGRRAGAHSDAYIEVSGQQIDIKAEESEAIAQEQGEVSHTYVLYDKFATEFFDVPFPLTDATCKGSMKTFDEIANAAAPITYDPFTVLRMDAFVVHRCSVCSETTERTFMKISFSKKKYSREGNTINPEFTYDWDMTTRSPERNHPWK